jgi:hypothetical protein
MGPILIIVAIATGVGIYNEALVPSITFIIIALIDVLFVIVMLISAIKFAVRWLLNIKKGPAIPPEKLDPLAFQYFICVNSFGITVFCALLSLFGIAQTMLGIQIGPQDIHAYNLSRWLLLDAIVYFVSASFILGATRLQDGTQGWPK